MSIHLNWRSNSLNNMFLPLYSPGWSTVNHIYPALTTRTWKSIGQVHCNDPIKNSLLGHFFMQQIPTACCDYITGNSVLPLSLPVTISLYAYYIWTDTTFSFTNPWCHHDITMTSFHTMTSLTPLWHHLQNTINTLWYHCSNLTCSYFTW